MKVTPLYGGGGGVLLYKWLMGMCHWLRLHFHQWIDFNVSHISTELLVHYTSRITLVVHFRIFGGKKVLHIYS